MNTLKPSELRRCMIGIDFDNTIAGYDHLIHREALRRRLIPRGAVRSKRLIRDAIRRLPDGDLQWQKLQAAVYGPLMPHAELIEGVGTFLRLCRAHEIPVHIISHKKARYRFDPTGTDFRAAALSWMERNDFFRAPGFNLKRRQVHFEATRARKIQRIEKLGCTHFIDDLEETFLDDHFPARTRKILYNPHGNAAVAPGILKVRRWKEIVRYFFNALD